MRALIFPFVLILFFVLPPREGDGQTFPPEITTHTSKDYKEHNQILSTEVLPGGRQAFGTADVVLTYDGEAFEKVFMGNGKYALAMDADSAGRLFVGGVSLMGMIAPNPEGDLAFHSLKPLLPDSLKNFDRVWDIHCDGDGGVYFNAFDQLFYYKGDTVKVVHPGTRFYRFHHPSGRPVAQVRDSGLVALSGAEKEHLPGSKSLVKGKRIHGILPASEDEPGTWTVFTGSHGIHHYDPSTGNVSPLRGPEGKEDHRELRKAEIYTAARLDPRNNPYEAAYAVGTRLNGFYLLGSEGRILLHLRKEDGLPSDLIWDLRTDRSGNIWAGTDNGIALLHTGLPFTVAGEKVFNNAVVYDIDRSIPPDRAGAKERYPLFLATPQGSWKWQEEEGSFSMVPGAKGESFNLQPYHPSDAPSRMMIAGAKSGLLSASAVKDPSPASSSTDTLSGHYAYALSELETHRGPGVLVGGREGLHVFAPPEGEEGTWKKTLSVEEFPEEFRAVGFDRMKSQPDSVRLWGGMPSEGLLAVRTDTGFSGHASTHYRPKDGLPEGEIRVFSDPSEGEENAVFGTNGGLYELKDGSLEPACRYGRIFCDSSRQVFSLEKGVDGELWINDVSGGRVKHLIPEGSGYRIDSSIFRAVELGAVRALHAEKGRTWIGGDRGLACYHTDAKVDPERPWDCVLREVRGSGDSLLFDGYFFEERGKRRIGADSTVTDRVHKKEQAEDRVPVLPYSKNRMEFAFAAPFPTRQKAVMYSYKLSGFDTAWSEWSQEAKKEYTNLSEGSYTFKAKARNVYMEESRTVEYRFRILPPWYRTWTAYGGYTIAGIGLIWLIAWLNSRRLVAQKQRLERIVDERTKEIREQKEKVEEQQRETEKQKEEVEKKNRALEEANETISQQKEEVEEQKEKVEEAHQEITQSIDYAQKIQYALLQSEEQVSPHVPDHFILFKPQSQVSGDFYWGKEHKGYFYIAAVDCTGHGVPGAFMSMLGISQLNEIMSTDEVLTPGYILTDLRERVVRELSGSDPESTAKDGMDAAIVRMPIGNSNSNSNSKGGFEVQFAGAQNPLYVIRKGIAEEPPEASMEYQGAVGRDRDPSVQDPVKPFKKSSDGIEIKGDGQPVGYDEYAKEAFTTVKLRLRKDDMCYFFSDGYADQFGGPKGKKFRYGPFKELLASLHEKPLEEQKEELDRTFEDWKAEGEQEQIDDVVVIGVRL